MKLLYLHGFRSSPDSPKALDVAQYCKASALPEAVIPQLPVSPRESIKLCEQLIKTHQIDTICGSSLGGFYAMHLAEKHGLRCAVINPAITPWNELKQEHLQDRYQVNEISQNDATHYLGELHHYYTPKLTDLSRYLLLVATGDEVLSPAQMRAHFTGSREIVVVGGDHSLNGFGGHLNELMDFLQNNS